MKILVTGIAGFIGMHLGKKLLELGYTVFGIDNLNNYYDIELKKARIKELKKLNKDFIFQKINITNQKIMFKLFDAQDFDVVVHLAAQAGVRYSISNPYDYIDSNILGFMNILECCRKQNIEHLVFASSSSVYGSNTNIPFNENDNTDHPLSLYGATKKSNELMAHTYSNLYNIPTTGLRFFTVYGPWGRPDMAPFLFTESILLRKPIKVFNNGDMARDFTYIDDVIYALTKIILKKATANKEYNTQKPQSSSSNVPYRIFNIGNNNPIKLNDFIKTIENITGVKAIKEKKPMQPGDVKMTYANTDAVEKWLLTKATTDIEQGIKYFFKWYKNYYKM